MGFVIVVIIIFIFLYRNKFAEENKLLNDEKDKTLIGTTVWLIVFSILAFLMHFFVLPLIIYSFILLGKYRRAYNSLISMQNENDEVKEQFDIVENKSISSEITEIFIDDSGDDGIKKLGIDTSMKVGVSLVILSAIIFATTTWSIMDDFFKSFIILIVSGLFFSIASFTKKKDLLNTSISMFSLGCLFVPITVLSFSFFEVFDGFILSGSSLYFVQLLMALSLGIACNIGYGIYQSKYFMNISLFITFVFVFCLMMYISDNFRFSLLSLLVYTLFFIRNKKLYEIHNCISLSIIFVIMTIMNGYFDSLLIGSIMIFILYFINYDEYKTNIVKYIYPICIFFIGLFSSEYYLIILLLSVLIFIIEKHIDYGCIICFVLFFKLRFDNISELVLYLYFGMIYIAVLFNLNKNICITILCSVVSLFIFSSSVFINLIILILLFIIYFLQKEFKLMSILVFNIIPIYSLYILSDYVVIKFINFIYLIMALGLVNYVLSIKNKSYFGYGVVITYLGYIIMCFMHNDKIFNIFLLVGLVFISNIISFMKRESNLFSIMNVSLGIVLVNYLNLYYDMAILCLFFTFIYMMLGRLLSYKVLFDYLSLSSIIFILNSGFSDFIAYLLFLIYFINLIGRYNIVLDKILSVIIGIVIIILVNIQPFIDIDILYIHEINFFVLFTYVYSIVYIFKKFYNIDLKIILYILLVICVIIQSIYCLTLENLFDVFFLLSVMVISLIYSVNKNDFKYIILSCVTIVLIVFYLTREFWFSIAWWIYLLVIGMILILSSVLKEISKK